MLFMALPMWCMSIQATTAVDIFVMNDIHVMHPDLLKQDGTAFENVMNSDRKLLRQSQEIFLNLIDSILLHKPDVVLIPGDLTKDGELIGHQLVATALQRLSDAGIQTYVIPGNHDILNAAAKYFDGDQTTQAEITKKEDFETIYQNFGYNAAIRDTASLSYMVDIAPGVALLAIDAVQWYNNKVKSLGDDKDQCIAQGALRAQTLQWILDRADEAKAAKKQVIAMMHQQLLQHLEMQDKVFPTAAITNGDSIAKLFIEHGIHAIFTGHMHITNNTTYYSDAAHTDSIVEISTGAPVSYPCPYRWVSVDASSRELKVATHTVQTIESKENFVEFAKESLGNSAENLVRSQVAAYWPLYETLRTTGKLEFGGQIIDVSSFKKFFNFCPSTQEECIAIADYHFNDVARTLLFTTAEGNEPDRPEVNTYIRTTIETKIQFLIDSIIDNNMCQGVQAATGCGDAGLSSFEAMIYKAGILPYAKQMYEGPLNSILEDISYMNTDIQNVTDDLNLLIMLPNRDWIYTNIEDIVLDSEEGPLYDLLGRPVVGTPERGFYVRKGQKIFIP